MTDLRLKSKVRLPKMFQKLAAFLVFFIFCFTIQLRASESDQFTTPTLQLKDSTRIIEENLKAILIKNFSSLDCVSEKNLIKKQKGFRAKELDGAGIGPAKGMNPHIEPTLMAGIDPEALFKPSPDIYKGLSMQPSCGLAKLLPKGAYASRYLTPTLRLNGIDIGQDKIGHIFQDGSDYWEEFLEKYSSLLAQNKLSLEELTAVTQKLIVKGIYNERHCYGETIDGLYANADLAANMAGFLFYLSLYKNLPIEGLQKLTPIFSKDRAGEYCFDPKAFEQRTAEGLIFPFITPHLNEALNAPRSVLPEHQQILIERAKVLCEKNKSYQIEMIKNYYRANPTRQADKLESFFQLPYGRHEEYVSREKDFTCTLK
jgi:hypothetical protein